MVDASGAVRTKIAVTESVLQLGWVGGTTLICCTAGAIHTWPDNGTQLGCRLANNTPSPYLSFSTSPDSRFLAVVTDNKEVRGGAGEGGVWMGGGRGREKGCVVQRGKVGSACVCVHVCGGGLPVWGVAAPGAARRLHASGQGWVAHTAGHQCAPASANT